MSMTKGVWNEWQKVSAARQSMRGEDSVKRLASNEKFASRLPIIYANNYFVLSRDGAWTGFHIENKPWGFLDKSSRKQYFRAANSVFGRIFPSGKDNSGHLIVTNRVYTAEDWETGLLARYAGTASQSFERYVRESRKVVEQGEFFERECYLFTRMGDRGSQGGVLGVARSLFEMMSLSAGMDDNQPSEQEKEHWDVQSASTVDSLSSSWLRAEPIHRRRVEWLTRHLDTPSLPTPDVAPADDQEWGAGAWRTVLASYTDEFDLGVVDKMRIRCVRVTAPTGAGTAYAAFLPVNHIPGKLHYEQNWLHHASSLPYPVDASLHFEILDPDRAEKTLQKPMNDAEAQEEEDAEAGIRPDETVQLQQAGLRQVKTNVRMNRDPIASWQCVFAVYDTNPDQLRSKVVKLIKHYKDIHFELVCPPWDQRELFYQSFPGSNIRVSDWMHRTETQYLAASQPWLTSNVGDREGHYGLYQGYTIVRDANGMPHAGVPVFSDLQNVVDKEGRAPTEVGLGVPGCGKTVSRGLKVCHEDALRGITQLVWDPKGDFSPLWKYAALMQLDPAKVKMVNLRDPNNSVSLDAFGIAEVDPTTGIDSRETSALDMLTTLCHAFVNNPQFGLQYSNILGRAVTIVLEESAADGTPPTMKKVLHLIHQWRNGEKINEGFAVARREQWMELANNLDDYLRSVEKDPLGRLLFRDPSEAGTIRISQGDLVIFVALNLTPTDPGATPNRSTLISDVISGLMTDFIRSLLYRLPDEVPKSATFDEWHVIKRTSRADALVDWLRRMGRSKRCMVRQLSQSAKDFDKGSLSTVWAGQVDSDEEAEASCALLGIEPSRNNIDTLKALGKGQFLFRDANGRVAHVQVDIWDAWLLDKFNTQAEAKAALEKEFAAQGDTV